MASTSVGIRMLLPAILLTGVLGCAPELQQVADEPSKRVAGEQALRDADAAFTQAVMARDLEMTVSFYAEEASYFPVAEPIVIGKAAIREEWEHLFAIPGYDTVATLTKAEVSASGDLGFTQGSYETLMHGTESDSVTEQGKWVTVWKKQADGSWKVVADIYNTDDIPPDHQ